MDVNLHVVQGLPDEPCPKAVVPANTMLTLGALAQLMAIERSARGLGAVVDLAGELSLREALIRGTALAIAPQMIRPPAKWLVDGQEGRLVPALRRLAQTRDPRKILTEAALQFDRDPEFARASADLAVSGRMSYKQFAQNPPTRASLAGDVKARMAEIYGGLQTLSDAQIDRAVTPVLDRAYQVAYSLRGPYPQRAAVRQSLGWIAVSAEDDAPHRPVNTVSAPYPQYEIPVSVGHVTVQTRFLVASPPQPAERAASCAIPVPEHALPPPASVLIPEGDRIIVFLHGLGSSAEEALGLIPHLHDQGMAQGVRFTVISLDLPTHGYSSMQDHSVVAPADTTFPSGLVEDHTPIHTPLLDFVEDFVVAFVDALDGHTPIKNRFAGVIGGSLGGSLGLRLGRRSPRLDWLDNGIVSWSPASVWAPYVQDFPKSLASQHCRDKWLEAENDSYSRLNFFKEGFDGQIYDSAGKQNLDKQIAMLFMGPVANLWHRPNWCYGTENCAVNAMSGARYGRQEIYNQFFRRWHWRLAGEQLIFSHIDRVNHEDASSPLRYTLNRVRQLLIAGDKDAGGDLYRYAVDLAPRMINTPGRALFFGNTGHSIHDERPSALAAQIVSFLTVEAT